MGFEGVRVGEGGEGFFLLRDPVEVRAYSPAA